MALLASGGHTSLVLCNGISDYSILGSTIDDALGIVRLLNFEMKNSFTKLKYNFLLFSGEAFDKVSRMMQLSVGSNGGAMIEKAAKNGKSEVFNLPIPLQRKINCNFSYSGLKTSFRFSLEKLGDPKALEPQLVSDICASFQKAAFRHVTDRVGYALRYLRYKEVPVSNIVVVGGVACNEELRR